MTPSGKRPPGKIVAIVAVLACVGGGVAFAAVHDSPPPDPDAGLSADQRDTLYKGITADFRQNYAEWLESEEVKSLDLDKVRQEVREEPIADPGYTTLEQAVDAADVAVQGTVQSIKFVPYATVTDFVVEDVAKGEAPRTITLLQSSSLSPEPDFKGAYLAIDYGAPLLREGDEAVLLLTAVSPEEAEQYDPAQSGGGAQAVAVDQPAFHVQAYTGQYEVSKKDKKLKKIKKNKIADVDGKSAKEVMARIKARAEKVPDRVPNGTKPPL